MQTTTLLPAIEALISANMRTIKGQQAMLLTDVAKIYEVSPEELKKRVVRNKERFPKDFMFSLTKKEMDLLNTKFNYTFTEKGILMAGGVLKSKRAIQIHIEVIRHFVAMYKSVQNDELLLKKLRLISEHEDIAPILEVIKNMMKD